MARIARVVVPGIPHHITQRGVRRMDVFFSDDDRHAYLDLLAKQGRRFGVSYIAWCLMNAGSTSGKGGEATCFRGGFSPALLRARISLPPFAMS
jgi:hypothetical protein